MLSDYEQRLLATAERFLSAHEAVNQAAIALAAARTQYDSVRDAKSALQNELAQCVGANLQRRVFRIVDKVITVEYRLAGDPVVYVDDVICSSI